MNYLRKLLKEKNITQKELAKRSGVSTSSIHKYINGHNQMTIHTAFNLSIALGVEVGEFVKGVLNGL